MSKRTTSDHSLVSEVSCPHCWGKFVPERVLFVAEHTDLTGDELLGDDVMTRFRPSRFNPDGDALDARGMPCRTLACPECHRIVPRELLMAEPLILSTIGVPSSGKSYYLAALISELRELFAREFAINFTDVDAAMNAILLGYERRLFGLGDSEKLTSLDKTQMDGELYKAVRMNDQTVMLPQPFLFSMKPVKAKGAGRVMCLYDNAGEHFLPGENTSASRGTQHMAHAKMLLYLYDPIQNPSFRRYCAAVSSDPQIQDQVVAEQLPQEAILSEAARRIRDLKRLRPSDSVDKVLMVLVTKADIWAAGNGGAVARILEREPFIPARKTKKGVARVDTDRIMEASNLVRDLMLQHDPNFVTTAEDVGDPVVYLPVSALGCSPEADTTDGGTLKVRPKNLSPRWVTSPILYALSTRTKDFFGNSKSR